MCFSAQASFTGGAIISTIGVMTITKVQKPSQLLFAFIPIFFGIQQFTEGLVWLSLPNPEYLGLKQFSTYLFMIMADVLWPTMIPLAILLMEENRKKRKILKVLLVMGISLSLYYGICLIFFNFFPEIKEFHIQYRTDFPESLKLPMVGVYLIVTLVPLFMSSIKRSAVLGGLMLISCAISVIFFTQYLTSVWCFFAALISGVIYWIMKDSKQNSTINDI